MKQNTLMKDIFNKRTLNIFSVIIGALFILSGLGKAIDIAGFSNLTIQYGLGFLHVLAPLIVLFEILLGLSLVLLINPQRDGKISFWMLTIFTALFAFAHFNYGVNNCGCFGTIQHTTLPPIFSFIRNFILIIMSFIVWFNYSNKKIDIAKWKKYLIISVMSISIFITGLTVSTPLFTLKTNHYKTPKFQNENIKNTELSNYLQTSLNSTYLFFCFSYACPDCWNSIENLRSFIRNNVADSVIVFATGEEKDRLIFEEIFKPDFPIINLSSEAMNKLLTVYPTMFYIQNDTIKAIIPGQLPSPFVFKNILSNSSKINKLN